MEEEEEEDERKNEKKKRKKERKREEKKFSLMTILYLSRISYIRIASLSPCIEKRKRNIYAALNQTIFLFVLGIHL